MELIQDIGMVENDSGNKYRKGIYLCGKCNKKYEMFTHNVKRKKMEYCLNCILVDRNTKHGNSKSIAYKCWKRIMYRCYNNKFTNFSRWGGRGITVCDEWKDSFDKFNEWFLLNYEDGLQIDRIDNDKGYSPENCRFVSASDNINNSSKKINKIGKYRYVVWHNSSQKWRAVFRGKYIGSYNIEDDAYNALCNDIGYMEHIKNSKLDYRGKIL